MKVGGPNRAMFVTVKYGDEQEQIFNPDCRNEVLLHFIKTQCHRKADDVVDLSDERGMIKNLRRYPREYAREYLKDRETLILLRVDTCTPPTLTDDTSISDKVMYTPMLSSLVSNLDFIDMLNPPREDDAFSDTLSVKSYRRRSSMYDIDEFKNKPKSKSNTSNTTRKPNSRRGQRPPLRKTTNAS